MTDMEKNTSNPHIIRIEKALEMKKSSELRNHLYALQIDNSLSDFEFFDVIGDIYRRAPVFFMLEIYPKIKSKFRKVYGNEGSRVMDKYILEKFGLDEGEQILFEFDGEILLTALKQFKFEVNKGRIFVTNHRLIAHGNCLFTLIVGAGNERAFRSYISTDHTYLKPCYGYSFPIKNLYSLTPLSDFQRQNKKRKLTYFSIGRKIEINPSKKENTLDRLYEILNEFQMRDKTVEHKKVKCIKCGNEFAENTITWVNSDTCSDCMKAILDHQKEKLRLTFLKQTKGKTKGKKPKLRLPKDEAARYKKLKELGEESKISHELWIKPLTEEEKKENKKEFRPFY